MQVFESSLIDHLPPKAREKALILDEERGVKYAALRSALADLENGWARRDAMQVKVRASIAEHIGTHHRKLHDDELERINEPFRRIEREIEERLQPRHDRAQQAWQQTDYLSKCDAWLREAVRSGTRLRDASFPPFKGADYHREVERCRRRLDELAIDWQNAEAAARPLADLRKAIIDEIDALAELGRPRFDMTVRDGSPIKLIEALRDREVSGRTVGDPHAVLAWAMRDLLLEKALALVGNVEPERALTDDERDAEFDRISNERLKVERLEECVIVAASEVGLSIARRLDADPRAILELAD